MDNENFVNDADVVEEVTNDSENNEDVVNEDDSNEIEMDVNVVIEENISNNGINKVEFNENFHEDVVNEEVPNEIENNEDVLNEDVGNPNEINPVNEINIEDNGNDFNEVEFDENDVKYHFFFGYHISTIARVSLVVTALIGAVFAMLLAVLAGEFLALMCIPIALFGAVGLLSETRDHVLLYAVINVVCTMLFGIYHMTTRLNERDDQQIEDGDIPIIVLIYGIFLAVMLIAPTWIYYKLTTFLKDRENAEQLIPNENE